MQKKIRETAQASQGRNVPEPSFEVSALEGRIASLRGQLARHRQIANGRYDEVTEDLLAELAIARFHLKRAEGGTVT
jgi:hypothetical protein